MSRQAGDNAAAAFRQAVQHHQAGQLDHAEALYHEVLRHQPRNVEALQNLGVLANQRGQHESAIALFQRALAIAPRSTGVLVGLGLAEQQLDRPEEALARFERALALQPDYPEALYYSGNALGILGRNAEALARFERALALRPGYVEARNSRGVALSNLHRHDEAIASYGEALVLRPDFVDARINRGMVRLLRGDFAGGWEDLGGRWRDPRLAQPAQQFAQPLWLGAEPLAGKRILLHAEYGFGDTIQSCRYVPMVAGRGAQVILEVQATLVPLLTQLPGAAQVVARNQPLPEFDLHCPLLSLPLAFHTELATIPCPPAYLHADATRVERWKAKLGGRDRPRIGIAWSGSVSQRNDQRPVPLQLMARLCLPGLQVIGVQKDLLPADRAALAGHTEFRNFAAELTDFAETAALLSCLDLVITVDTAVAHLAGALGRPVWILLAFNPDWRWLLDREDSPWYPSARLFRQLAPGDWTSVIEGVAGALHDWQQRRPVPA